MNFDTICNKVIRPKLTDMLGRVLAEGIYQKARFAAAAERDDQHKLRVFVATTCSDPKFIGMWGTAQAARQGHEWLALLE
jgi:hypothetical protein